MKIFKSIQEILIGFFDNPGHRQRLIRGLQTPYGRTAKRQAHLNHQRNSFVMQEKELLKLGFKKKANGGFTR